LGDDGGKVQSAHGAHGHLPGTFTAQASNGRVLVGREGRINEGASNLLGNFPWISLYDVAHSLHERAPACGRCGKGATPAERRALRPPPACAGQATPAAA
jgi:hypothetical protein